MPRQPQELSTIAATSNTRPCQVRWRTLLIVTLITGCRFGLLLARSALVVRLAGCWFGLLLARSALVVRLTGPLLVRMPPQRVARVRRVLAPTAATVQAPAAVPPDRESRRAPAAAAVSGPDSPAIRDTAPAREAARRKHSGIPAGSAGSTGPARCPARPSVRQATRGSSSSQ